ncbi:MAG: imidazolonepropionase [Planctomycetota bacterium]
MSQKPLFIEGCRLVSPGGEAGAMRGGSMGELRVIERCDVLIENGCVSWIDADEATMPPGAELIRAEGRVLMPAFVDAHTHACWAGDRLDEWDRKLAGAGYLDLLEAGGGIMSTVRAVREASEFDLADALVERLNRALRHGVTTIEVKSGYGLTTEGELKMLRGIASAADRWAGTVTLTACIGHAIDPDRPDHVGKTIGETLPAITAEFPDAAIDAYCEQGAWSLADCVRLFDAASNAGHTCRVHADQFNDLGMIPEAIRIGLRSVDHLEATSPEHLAELARSPAFGVALPISGFHTDGRYANMRAFVDVGGALVLASNWNPGSSPSCSVPLAMALGVRFGGLRPAEAINAVTANAADLLGLEDRGRVRAGMRADLVLLHHKDERELCHEVGGNPVRLVICEGIVRHNARPVDGFTSRP